MKAPSNSMQANYNLAIGENHNKVLSRTAKNRTTLRHTPSPGTARNRRGNKKHPIACTFITLSCLALVSNFYLTAPLSCNQRVQRQHTAHQRDLTFFPAYCYALPQSIISASGVSRCVDHATALRQIVRIATDTLSHFDIPFLPTASAHVLPKTTTSTPRSTPSEEVHIKKINFDCIIERNSLSLAQTLRQIGKTLESPVSELAKESQIIHYARTLMQGCPEEEADTALMAISRKVDNIVSNIVNLLPGATSFVVTQNIGGPLLQLLADRLEGIPIDSDRLSDIDEQIIFCKKRLWIFLLPQKQVTLILYNFHCQKRSFSKTTISLLR